MINLTSSQIKNFMISADSLAKKGIENKDGGPFGSVVVRLSDKVIIGSGWNHVLVDNDPTSHGEINAIRNACKNLNSYDLSGCVLFTNAEPCPMCLSACIWANLDGIYYSNTKEDTANIGFRDDAIYKFIRNRSMKNPPIKIKYVAATHDQTLKTFEQYSSSQGTIY